MIHDWGIYIVGDGMFSVWAREVPETAGGNCGISSGLARVASLFFAFWIYCRSMIHGFFAGWRKQVMVEIGGHGQIDRRCIKGM